MMASSSAADDRHSMLLKELRLAKDVLAFLNLPDAHDITRTLGDDLNVNDKSCVKKVTHNTRDKILAILRQIKSERRTCR